MALKVSPSDVLWAVPEISKVLRYVPNSGKLLASQIIGEKITQQVWLAPTGKPILAESKPDGSKQYHILHEYGAFVLLVSMMPHDALTLSGRNWLEEHETLVEDI